MSAIDSTQYISVIILIIFAIIVIAFASNFRHRGLKGVQDRRTGRQYYVDSDLRLTYGQYMKYHPDSNFTYAEYKRAQAQRAYTKSGSSKDLKRMVR